MKKISTPQEFTAQFPNIEPPRWGFPFWTDGKSLFPSPKRPDPAIQQIINEGYKYRKMMLQEGKSEIEAAQGYFAFVAGAMYVREHLNTPKP